MRKLLLSIALLVPAAAFAGGYDVPNLNPRDLAMAGSGVAAQQDAAATYGNPSALAGLRGFSLSAAASLINFSSTYAGGGQQVSMTPKGVFPPALYAAYGDAARGMGLGGSDLGYGIGLGVTLPAGGEVFWPGNWPGRYDIVTVDRRVYGFYLTGGVQPLPFLKLGGGAIYYRTTEKLSRAINFGTGTDGSGELATSGGQLSYDVSAELTPLPDLPLTIGIDYKHHAVQKLSGDGAFHGVPAALRPYSLDQSLTHTLTYPNLLNIGASFKPIPALLIAAAWSFDRYVEYQQDLFQGSAGTNIVVARQFHNGYTLRAGAELEVLPIVKVRAGILRDVSPSRAEHFSPSLPDNDSTGFSAGVGIKVAPGLDLNAAYFYDSQDWLNTNNPDTFQGSYKTHANIWSVGLSYAFGNETKRAQ